LILAAAFAGPGCNQPASPQNQPASTATGADACQAEPLAPFDCSIAGGMPGTSTRFSGQVTGIEPADEFGRLHYVVREASGAEHRLALKAPDQTLPIVSGGTYDFELDRVGGTPTASGLIVRDEAGVLFAAASDQGIGDHVLADGAPGITLGLVALDCSSRPHDACVEGIFNRTLQVSIAGQEAALHNGESAVVGGYSVRCLIAQQVKYSARCRDFALFGVSYTIARVK
jgi:hypothetical protein